MFRKNI